MRISLWTVFIRSCLFTCLTVLAHASEAQAQYNNVSLKGGIEITLPPLPTDPADLAAFQSLTPQERESFYYKRAWMIQKLAGGLAKPGLGRSIRWTKNKITTTIAAVRSRLSIAEQTVTDDASLPDEESAAVERDVPVIEFNRVPDNLSENTKAVVETSVTSLVNNMWANSTGIAKSSGVGMSFVVGVIWNTTLGMYGVISGRSLSVDIGMDFQNDRGYINFFIDKQTKSKGGLSFDVGTMFDVLLHITDPTTEVGATRFAIHQKLPVIGCFRRGPNYRAWGSMIGVHVLEVAAAVMTVLGYPEAGFATLAGVRAIGFATMYQTNLEQRVIRRYEVPPDHWLVRKLRFEKLRAGFSGRTCQSLFAPANRL